MLVLALTSVLASSALAQDEFKVGEFDSFTGGRASFGQGTRNGNTTMIYAHVPGKPGWR